MSATGSPPSNDEMSDFIINGVNLLNPDPDRHRVALREVMKKSAVPSFNAIFDMKTSSHDSRVSRMKRFPFEEFSETDLNETVFSDSHISSCKVCRSHVEDRRILYGTKANDINFSNCINLRKLSLEYGDQDRRRNVDTFINDNFSEACKLRKNDLIRSLSEEDIFRYVRTVRRSCNKFEFEAIVVWLNAAPERYYCFPKLIVDDSIHNLFRNSLRSLCEIGNDTVWSSLSKLLRTTEHGPSWLVSLDNCGFVRFLAQQDHCEMTRKQADTYIYKNLSEFSKKINVRNLPFEAVETYASDEKFYEDGSSIWNLIKHWMKMQKNTSREHLSQIMESVLVQKLSIAALKEYCEHDTVRDSVQCQMNIVQVVLGKVLSFEDSYAFLKTRIDEVRDSIVNISKTSDSRSAVFEKWKLEATSQLSRNEENTKACKELQKRVAQLEASVSKISTLENRMDQLEAQMKASTRAASVTTETTHRTGNRDKRRRYCTL